MLEHLYRQFTERPNELGLNVMIKLALGHPSRTLDVMFVPDEELDHFNIRIEVRDAEHRCLDSREFPYISVPHLHQELIRNGKAELYYKGQVELAKTQLERLHKSLFKE